MVWASIGERLQMDLSAGRKLRSSPSLSQAERRLAAIMFTDMAGYASLSQANEDATMELLEEHRALLRPVLSRYGGREVKTMGDAFLVEFLSSLQAVRCALDIQSEIAVRNGQGGRGGCRFA